MENSELITGEGVEQTQEDIGAVLAQVINEISESGDSEGFVSVYRLITGKSNEYITRYSLDEIESEGLLEKIRADFGAGKYHITVYKGGTGGIKTRKIVKLAALPGSNSNNERKQDDGMAAILKTMQEGFAQMAQSIAAANRQTDELQMLEKMKAYKELFEFNQSKQIVGAQSGYNPQELIGALMSGVKLARGIGSEKLLSSSDGESVSNGDWLERVLEKFAEPLLKVVLDGNTKVVNEGTSGVQATTGETKEKIVSRGTEKTESAGGDMSEVNTMVKLYVNQLVVRAAKNADVETEADKLFMMMDGDISVVKEQGWFEKLAAINPGVSNYRAWFEQLHDRLIALESESFEQE